MKHGLKTKTFTPEKWVYNLIRFAHLLSSAAVFPLAIYYMKYDIGGFRDHSTFALVFIWIGALCFPMLHLFIEQYTYPLKLSGAFMFSGAFSLNIVGGLSLSDFISTYSAYQVFMTSLIVQIISLSAGAFYGYFSQLKGKQVFSSKVDEGVFLLFAFYITVLSFLLYAFIPPLISQFKNENNFYLFIFALICFGIQIFSSVRALWNTYLNKSKRFDHEDSMTMWLVPSGIAMLISLIAALIIALRDY